MYCTAITACPFPYSKACDTSRPRVGQGATIRAGLGGKAFVHLHIPCAMLNSLVRQHFPEGRPACIQHGLRQAGLGESGGIDIADNDMVKRTRNLQRRVMQRIEPAARRIGMDGLDPAPFMRALRGRERRFGLAIEARCRNPIRIRQYGQVFQTQVNADSMIDRSHWRFGNLNHDIEEPVAAAVLRKAGAILDLALGKRPRVEHAEGMSSKAKRIAFPVQVAPLDPRSLESQGIFLPVVAVIPDEIHRTAPLIKQSAQRLHTIAKDENHTVILYSISQISRRAIATQSAPFTPRPEGRDFSEQP
ncbi:hypothetical protein SAMN05518865_101490 [Duganella sp. CF458]|nr:hypothetical protein SAMN05518865_101490 [Duganella sp. CF458]